MNALFVRWPALLALLLLSCAPVQEQRPAPPPPATRPSVAVLPTSGLILLVSDSSPSYIEAAQEISQAWKGEIVMHNLADRTHDTFKIAQASPWRLVAAVGADAARLARKLTNKHVVFCQVFQGADRALIAPWMKGVSALPPAALQFRVWKQLNPSLKRIGVITGSHLESVISEARAAATQQHAQLVHVEVGSDLEMLYAFKNLLTKVDGFWLVPDNRVLSRRVLRDVLTLAHKEGKQVVVFGEKLLPLGGIMSVEADPSDVARQVLARLQHAGDDVGQPLPGPDVQALTKAVIEFNPTVVKRFGLKVPKSPKVVQHVR